MKTSICVDELHGSRRAEGETRGRPWICHHEASNFRCFSMLILQLLVSQYFCFPVIKPNVCHSELSPRRRSQSSGSLCLVLSDRLLAGWLKPARGLTPPPDWRRTSGWFMTCVVRRRPRSETLPSASVCRLLPARGSWCISFDIDPTVCLGAAGCFAPGCWVCTPCLCVHLAGCLRHWWPLPASSELVILSIFSPTARVINIQVTVWNASAGVTAVRPHLCCCRRIWWKVEPNPRHWRVCEWFI